MRRREFITFVGGMAATWPLAARGQQAAIPTIGFLHSGADDRDRHNAFLHGLSELGFVEGQNVLIEYRWAEGTYARLPALANELVDQKVTVLLAGGAVMSPRAAKAATSTIPIVFAIGSDPVKVGLVPSLNHPVGNITGVSFFTAELESKRLGLLHELIPQAKTIGAFINPSNANAEKQIQSFIDAARILGLEIKILKLNSEHDFAAAFESAVQSHVGGIVFAADPYFFSQYGKLVAMAGKYKMPAIYEWREYAEAGGLASYGTNLAEVYRQAGNYVGQILKGTKPEDLPVMQAIRFEFLINLKTAKALGIDVPPGLSARADEVIE